MSVPGSGQIPWPMIGGALGIAATAAGAAYVLNLGKNPEKAAVVAGGATLTALSVWEASWYLYRWRRRAAVYNAAVSEAVRLGRPLIVVGAPDGGVTSGYGCGSVTIDLSPSACPNWKPLDITKTLPFATDSVVVFCSCVLEYVSDPIAAIAELKRISGGYLYIVGVEPWTLAGLLYPGAKQTLPALYR